jgi:rfaE bifunctional protein kinase chain/domain
MTLDLARLHSWGQRLAAVLQGGGRLLVAGNGGSAAQAQHLSAELVGRYRDDRPALSAFALHADTSTLTAVSNDYGSEQVYARQVRAHGRPGDILLTLSTSGRSANLAVAVSAARSAGMVTWALTGPAPNPLAEASDAALTVEETDTGAIQECHLVAIHLLCTALDDTIAAQPREQAPAAARPTAARASGAARHGGLVMVGDCLLDRDLAGTVSRVSPEGPVLVVGELVAGCRPGGAGPAALLAARDGYPVTLVTALAQDPAADELRALLRAAGIAIVDLELDGLTPVKTRIRVADRTLLMLDQAQGSPCFGRALSGAGRDALADAKAVLVSDYRRGLTALPELREAISRIVPATPVVWDPHPLGSRPVARVCLVTPNRREAKHFAGGVEGSGLIADIERARVLLAEWEVPRVAVTRGEAGAILVESAATAPLIVNCENVLAPDSCGAGDRFAAAATAKLAEGAVPSEAVAAAVTMASSYVASGGASQSFAG